MGHYTLKKKEESMKCWMCGKDNATVTRELKHVVKTPRQPSYYADISLESQRCYCQECFNKHAESLKRENEMYIKLKKRRMLEKAIDILEHQDLKLYEFREAIRAVREFIEDNPDKFDSSYEILAAIVLIKHRIKCKMQYKVGRYQVDMLLPDLFVALEIDGERHKHTKIEDSRRDFTIKMVLGSQWEVVRIKTNYLDQHAEHLLEAIKEVCDKRAFSE